MQVRLLQFTSIILGHPIVTGIQTSSGDDDYLISYDIITITGFRICITEQDNGTSPGVPRNNPFSVFIPIF